MARRERDKVYTEVAAETGTDIERLRRELARDLKR